MEDALHQLPFLCRGHTCLDELELGHVVLPLLLTGECGEAGHGALPLEVERGLDDHEQTGAEEVDLHLEDTDLADTLHDLFPDVFLAVAATILGNQFGIVAQVERLAISFYGTRVLLYGIAVLKTMK